MLLQQAAKGTSVQFLSNLKKIKSLMLTQHERAMIEALNILRPLLLHIEVKIRVERLITFLKQQLIGLLERQLKTLVRLKKTFRYCRQSRLWSGGSSLWSGALYCCIVQRHLNKYGLHGRVTRRKPLPQNSGSLACKKMSNEHLSKGMFGINWC